jgi:hypothetical protein
MHKGFVGFLQHKVTICYLPVPSAKGKPSFSHSPALRFYLPTLIFYSPALRIYLPALAAQNSALRRKKFCMKPRFFRPSNLVMSIKRGIFATSKEKNYSFLYNHEKSLHYPTYCQPVDAT